MSFFTTLIVLSLGGFYYRKLRSKTQYLEDQIAYLRRQISKIQGSGGNKPLVTDDPVFVPPQPEKKEFPQNVTISHSLEIAHSTEQPKSEPTKRPTFKDSLAWKKIEEQFSGNITGILGTLVLVLGICFLGIYAAIQMSPMGRCGIVALFSIGLYALYLVLSRKEFWRNISLWVRSSSGIVFLVACVGSIGFQSMRWIENPSAAIFVLVCGIAVNLTLGFFNGGQLFASIHVLLSLLALSLVPATLMTFTIAATISIVGIFMSSGQRKWDQHLTVTSLSFFILHFYWFYSSTANGVEFPIGSVTSILLCFAVGLAGTFTHYRKVYSIAGANKKPLIAHSVNWITLGLNLYLHSKGSKWATMFLAMGAIGTYFLSSKAKSLSIRWLFVSDRLVSLALVVITVFSLGRFNLSWFEMSVLGSVISVLFFRMILEDNEVLLSLCASAAVFLFQLMGGAIIFWSYVNDTSVETSYVLMHALSFFVFLGVFPSIESKTKDLKWGLLSGSSEGAPSTGLGFPLGLQGLLSIMLALNGHYRILMLVSLSVIWSTFYFRKKLKDKVLMFSSYLGGFLVVLLLSQKLLFDASALRIQSEYLILILSIGMAMHLFSWNEEIKQKLLWPGVIILWWGQLIGAYVLTKGISPALTGVLWLLTSVLACEFKNLKFSSIHGKNKHDKLGCYVLYAGLANIAFYLIRFFLVDIQNELWFAGLHVRVLLEAFSAMVVLYWLMYGEYERSPDLNKKLNYFLDLLVFLVSVYTAYELNSKYYPLLWIVVGFFALQIGTKVHRYNRLVVYAVGFYYVSLFHVAFVSTTLVTPSVLLMDQPWVLGLLSTLLCVIFMVVIRRIKILSLGDQLVLPDKLRSFQRLFHWLNKVEFKALLYPLMIAVALFLYWSFDKTILSLLWVVECFALFLISILSKESQFRIVSMAGIALVFLRIIFYDLVGSDFLIKALVFMSVGAILIAMNTIYNRYKHRYEN